MQLSSPSLASSAAPATMRSKLPLHPSGARSPTRNLQTDLDADRLPRAASSAVGQRTTSSTGTSSRTGCPTAERERSPHEGDDLYPAFPGRGAGQLGFRGPQERWPEGTPHERLLGEGRGDVVDKKNEGLYGRSYTKLNILGGMPVLSVHDPFESSSTGTPPLGASTPPAG
jgi:hypothetical protein